MDFKTLSDTELAELLDAVKAERQRRQRLCRRCGGETILYHLHICDGHGGANIPLDSDAARLLTSTTND